MISVTGGPTKVSCSLQRTLLFPPQLQALLSQAVLLPSGVRVLVAQLADVDPKAMQEAAVGLQV